MFRKGKTVISETYFIEFKVNMQSFGRRFQKAFARAFFIPHSSPLFLCY